MCVKMTAIEFYFAGPPTLPILGNAHYVIGKSHNRKLTVEIFENNFIFNYLPSLHRNTRARTSFRRTIRKHSKNLDRAKVGGIFDESSGH